MSIRKTEAKLDTCGCHLTICYEAKEDGTVMEYLGAFHAKCEEHSSLSDEEAFAAALHKARTINLGEEYGDGL